MKRAKAAPVYRADQRRAMAQAGVLMLSAILPWLGGAVVEAGTSGYLIEAPPLPGLWPVPLAAGFALWWLAENRVMPKLCRWLALAGWTALAAATFLFAATGLYARAHAVAGPEMRSQIAGIDFRGRGFSRTTTTTLALQDGTLVATGGYPAPEYGTWGRCMAVRRLTGPFGFAWLQVTEAAPLPPPPGPGHLAWPVQPVERAQCFSAKPLSELRATT